MPPISSPIAWLFACEHAVPAAPDWLTDREAEHAARMRYAKRRNDYRLGRWTAKRALASFRGLPATSETLATIDVRNARDGAPEAAIAGVSVPESISITDRAGVAVCAIHSDGIAVGCDLELVEPRSSAFVRDYLTAAEQAVVDAAGTVDARHCMANLFWSAKESALKVLRTGLRRDTRSVEVRLSDEQPCHGWQPLAVHAREGDVFPGWWGRFGPFVLTLACRTHTIPPRELAAGLDVSAPSALAAALPTHSWMSAPLVR